MSTAAANCVLDYFITVIEMTCDRSEYQVNALSALQFNSGFEGVNQTRCPTDTQSDFTIKTRPSFSHTRGELGPTASVMDGSSQIHGQPPVPIQQ